jgi:hypothetical protein
VRAGRRRRPDVTVGNHSVSGTGRTGVSRVLLAPACWSGLEEVPLQDASPGPPEILMSESQEHIMAGRRARQMDEFLAVCARYVRTRPELGLSTIRDNLREFARVMSAVPASYQR